MVGDLLRRERERQGKTIKDVELETSIRGTYIEAIEQGKYEVLPGDVYAKGFIRNYSKFLNMDGDSLIEQYNNERGFNKPETVDEMLEKNASVIKTTAAPQEPVQEIKQSKLFSSGDDYKERMDKSNLSRNIMIFLGVIVLFLAGVYIAFSDDGSDSTAAKPAAQSSQSVKKDAAKAADVKKDEKKNYDGVKVTVQFTDRCWTQIDVDDKTVFEDTAEPGQKLEYDGKSKVVVVAGNAGAVSLVWNGKDLGPMGNVGQVVERVMTKDSNGESAEPAVVSSEEVAPAAESEEYDEYVPDAAELQEEQPAAAEPAEPADAPVQSAPVEEKQ